jgi:hypothetical protein
MQASGELDEMRERGVEPVRREVLPRVVAGMFSGITLAALSCVVALVVAYMATYGFALSGLAAYTRLFGQVFSPSVTVVLSPSTLLKKPETSAHETGATVSVHRHPELAKKLTRSDPARIIIRGLLAGSVPDATLLAVVVCSPNCQSHSGSPASNPRSS